MPDSLQVSHISSQSDKATNNAICLGQNYFKSCDCFGFPEAWVKDITSGWRGITAANLRAKHRSTSSITARIKNSNSPWDLYSIHNRLCS